MENKYKKLDVILILSMILIGVVLRTATGGPINIGPTTAGLDRTLDPGSSSAVTPDLVDSRGIQPSLDLSQYIEVLCHGLSGQIYTITVKRTGTVHDIISELERKLTLTPNIHLELFLPRLRQLNASELIDDVVELQEGHQVSISGIDSFALLNHELSALLEEMRFGLTQAPIIEDHELLNEFMPPYSRLPSIFDLDEVPSVIASSKIGARDSVLVFIEQLLNAQCNPINLENIKIIDMGWGTEFPQVEITREVPELGVGWINIIEHKGFLGFDIWWRLNNNELHYSNAEDKIRNEFRTRVEHNIIEMVQGQERGRQAFELSLLGSSLRPLLPEDVYDRLLSMDMTKER